MLKRLLLNLPAWVRQERGAEDLSAQRGAWVGTEPRCSEVRQLVPVVCLAQMDWPGFLVPPAKRAGAPFVTTKTQKAD